MAVSCVSKQIPFTRVPKSEESFGGSWIGRDEITRSSFLEWAYFMLIAGDCVQGMEAEPNLRSWQYYKRGKLWIVAPCAVCCEHPPFLNTRNLSNQPSPANCGNFTWTVDILRFYCIPRFLGSKPWVLFPKLLGSGVDSQARDVPNFETEPSKLTMRRDPANWNPNLLQ